jgi:hypothetical protein
MVTSAHRVEVEVGADGPTSAPPSGAAAAAPQAGDNLEPTKSRGVSTTPAARRIVATGGAVRSCGGDPQDQTPPENYAWRVVNIVRTPVTF